MTNPCAFIGVPIKFGTICSVYPPTVKDIISDETLLQGYKLLTQTQEDVEDLIEEIGKGKIEQLPSPFEYILINMYHNSDFRRLITSGIESFTHEKITVIYERALILFGTEEVLLAETDVTKYRYLSADNFFEFQNMLRTAMGDPVAVPADPNESPLVKQIKAKSRKRMRQIAKNKKGGVSLTASLCAICCMGIGLTPLNVGEISYASVGLIINMYQQKEKYQTDVDSLLAGADPKKVKPKYWIRDKSDTVEVKI